MNIGIIRRIDNLGRIVIPKEIRDTFRIKSSDNLEINVENEVITKITYDELYKAISTLSEYEQDLIQCLFFLKPAMREVDFANKYGFTRRTVGYHKKLILEKLKEVLKF